MRAPSVSVATLLLAFGFSPCVWGQEAAQEPARKEATPEENFKSVDADGDGFITAAELVTDIRKKIGSGKELTADQSAQIEQMAKAIIANTDTNGDGRVSLKELKEAGKKNQAKEKAKTDGTTADGEPDFDAMDTNHDGQVTLEEVTAWGKKRLGADASEQQLMMVKVVGQMMVDKTDTDKDGKISKAEWEASKAPSKPKTLDELAAEKFKGMDKNADGQLTTEDLVAVLSDGNDKPTDEEKAAFKEKAEAYIKQTDQDGDGKISLKEYAAAVKKQAAQEEAQEAAEKAAAEEAALKEAAEAKEAAKKAAPATNEK